MSTSPHALGGRPPVEHRLFGLDRRTVKLPLIVVALFVLLTWVAPAVDKAVQYDQPVRAGDAFIIAPGVTMAPPVGWDVQAGVRERDDTRAPAGDTPSTYFSGNGIIVTTKAGAFTGDARALNAQVADTDKRLDASGAFAVKGRLETVTLDGHHGVARRYSALRGEGAIFTFADGGRGLEIVVSGKANALAHEVDEIARMLASVDFDSEADR